MRPRSTGRVRKVAVRWSGRQGPWDVLGPCQNGLVKAQGRVFQLPPPLALSIHGVARHSRHENVFVRANFFGQSDFGEVALHSCFLCWPGSAPGAHPNSRRFAAIQDGLLGRQDAACL